MNKAQQSYLALYVPFFLCSSQNNGPTVPVDACFFPLGAQDEVDWYRVSLLSAPIHSFLASVLVVFARLHGEDDVVLLASELIVVDNVEWALVQRYLLLG